MEYEDRGHNDIYYSEASRHYKEQLNEDYTSYLESNGLEHNPGIKEEFMKKNRDKSKCYEFDYPLMQRYVRGWVRTQKAGAQPPVRFFRASFSAGVS